MRKKPVIFFDNSACCLLNSCYWIKHIKLKNNSLNLKLHCIRNFQGNNRFELQSISFFSLAKNLLLKFKRKLKTIKTSFNCFQLRLYILLSI